MGTSGSEGGPGKPTSRKADRAPRPDPYTYVPTWTGFVYVAFVIDAFSRRIVGWRAARSMTTDLVLDALEHAFFTRAQDGVTDLTRLVAHSDAGSQGGINRSSQHLVKMEVFDGSSTTGFGSWRAPDDEIAWSSVSAQARGAGVLAADRGGHGQRGRRGRCGRVRAGRVAVVPPRWRHATHEPCRAVGPVSVVC